MSVEIRDCVYGKGLFVTTSYKTGDVLWTLKGIPVDTPTKTTIYIGNSEHVDDPLGIYFNHSFEPNCRIEGRSVVAMKDIEKDEHLTFDYTKNEPCIASPFKANGRWVK